MNVLDKVLCDKTEEHQGPLETPCRVFTGKLFKDGYGKMWISGKNVRVHRWVAAQVMGEPAPEEVVRHRCDNPRCIAPDHLEYGTVKDNYWDSRSRGRRTHKLNEHAVSVIKDMLQDGISQADIGRLFDLHPNRICAIKLGRIWSYVT